MTKFNKVGSYLCRLISPLYGTRFSGREVMVHRLLGQFMCIVFLFEQEEDNWERYLLQVS